MGWQPPFDERDGTPVECPLKVTDKVMGADRREGEVIAASDGDYATDTGYWSPSVDVMWNGDQEPETDLKIHDIAELLVWRS